MFVPISAFLLFLVAEIACEEECARFCRCWPIWRFWQFLPQLKTFSKNLNEPIILVLDVAFVPNLTFLSLLSSEISFGGKTQTDTQLVSPSEEYIFRVFQFEFG